MASALEPDAEIHTIEINDEQEDFTRPWLENSPWADRIRFHIGDALEFVNSKSLNGKWFDLVFIDADKRHYVDYYHAVLPRVRTGGFIIADNTLWDGQVVDAPLTDNASNGKEAQVQGILTFNDLVAADSSVERVILPLRDGLTLIRKLPSS